MALIEGCKHSLEITVPETEVDQETERAAAAIQVKVRLPGFRPGKAPLAMVKTRYAGDIRQEVLEKLVPRFLNEARLAYVRGNSQFPENDPTSPTVNINSFFTIGGLNAFPQGRVDHTWQYQDVASYFVGRNAIKQQLLRELYGNRAIDEMRAIKQAIDPEWTLAPGVLFDRA